MRCETPILELGDNFYDIVEAADFPETILRYRNDTAAAEVGLAELSDAEWIQHFGRFNPLEGSLIQPLALRYHGHQFRSYNPELGDGRGFLFAQLRDQQGRLMDLGTKGSGQTPWSRFGDGRLTLKGGVREILATTMLEALGVNTSRTLSLIETGEALQRGDEPSPTRSSVLVRLSHGHIRFGTFQRLAALQLPDEMSQLVDYALRHLLGSPEGADPYALLMEAAVSNMAQLAAEWHVAGFVHGVLNTDNMNITGESFDYGPWRFLPRWDMGFTAAYFDQLGLYAFGRQPESLHWNLIQLAKALRLVAPAESLLPALEQWPDKVHAALSKQFLWRLGLQPRGHEKDEAFRQMFETGLHHSGLVPDEAWFAYRGGRVPHQSHPAFATFEEELRHYQPVPDALSDDYWAGGGPETMLIDEVESLWSAIATKDDWGPLYAKLERLTEMGKAHRAA